MNARSAPWLRAGQIFCMTVSMLTASALPGMAQDTSPASSDLHALLPESVKQSHVIMLATDAHHPPCEYFGGPHGEMVGFEPDLWNEIGKRLGVTIKPVSIDFDGLIPSIQSQRFDIAMQCISDSAEREKQVLFVDYGYASTLIFALESNQTISKDPLSLCGMKAATQIGTDFSASVADISQRCIAQGRSPIAASQFNSTAAVLLALGSGRVDFVLDDGGAVEEIRQASHRPIKVLDVGIPNLMIGAIMKPDNTKLAQSWLAALQQIQRDGTYDQIMKKWHTEMLSMPPVMNGATQNQQNQ